ncbi:shikimate kinase [Macrococcus brunensis]|uniref:shikimate kinase n=1 Tax=Macrococcus brunensis TaxID=198483 RepID=UPI001EF03C37|nr:shikimate kinase [Macrococcus brunensis]ULG71089.1 shikimate kinase [Macrococcus brunensis]ULG73425.1 shikimate kinase [Macrococcus brunensis]
MTIVLVGFMGAGKTTIGKRLAQILDKPFIDLDSYIVEKDGRSIAEIFKTEGQEKFRQLEVCALKECLSQDAVLATGGGVIETPENIHMLKMNQVNIWLDTDIQELYSRITDDESRPNANGRTFLQIKELYNRRVSRYNEIAFMQVDSSRCVDDCVREIMDSLASL